MQHIKFQSRNVFKLAATSINIMFESLTFYSVLGVTGKETDEMHIKSRNASQSRFLSQLKYAGLLMGHYFFFERYHFFHRINTKGQRIILPK